MSRDKTHEYRDFLFPSTGFVRMETFDGSEGGQGDHRGTLIRIYDNFRSGGGMQYVGGLRISQDDAVKAAVQWLKDLGREDLLAEPPPERPLRYADWVQYKDPERGTTPMFVRVSGPDQVLVKREDGSESRIDRDLLKLVQGQVKTEVVAKWTVVE